jgi:hypothetical protein
VRGAQGATGAGLIDAAAAVQLTIATAINGTAAALVAATTPGPLTASIAASLLNTVGTGTPLASLATTGAASFYATLADPTGALGLADVAAGSAGSVQSLAMVNGFDPVVVPATTQT